jgi:hypothetical protein
MAAPLDPTFRNYNPQQAAKYAAHRGTYASRIIEAVLHITRLKAECLGLSGM